MSSPSPQLINEENVGKVLPVLERKGSGLVLPNYTYTVTFKIQKEQSTQLTEVTLYLNVKELIEKDLLQHEHIVIYTFD